MVLLASVSDIFSRRRAGLVAGPAAFVGLLAFSPFALPPAANAALAATLWIATWWVTEAVPIPATSLLPIVLFPATGVTGAAETTAPYADPVVFLLLGGFMLALGVERRNLHRRIALAVVSRVGLRSDRLLLGFMVATAVLSMWISNSATAMLMVPIATAILVEFESFSNGDETDGRSPADLETASPAGPSDPASPPNRATQNRRDDGGSLLAGLDTDARDESTAQFGLALMLGIAYGASIGGVATLVGSPPNAVFAGVAESRLGVEIGFLDWLVFAAPLSVVFLLVTWGVLARLLDPGVGTIREAEAVVSTQREALGPMGTAERRVLAVFLTVAAGWLLRPFVLQPLVPGFTDAAVAVVGSVLLFVVPAGSEGALLEWRDTARVPWGVLLLLGAGFSLANAFQASGLDAIVADSLSLLAGVPLIVLLLAVATVVVFLTEVTSNTATATVFMPILLGLGLTLGVSPLVLMAAASLAASFAFMLPVATPPNAIVFGSGYVTVPQMSRVGLWLNLLGIVAVVAITYAWLPVALRVAG